MLPSHSLSSNQADHLFVSPSKNTALGKKTLVLDLDGTLISTSAIEPEEPHIKVNVRRVFTTWFSLSIVQVNGKKEIRVYHLIKRPGLDEFIQRLSASFKIVIYTTSKKEVIPQFALLFINVIIQYAATIIKELGLTTYITEIYHRNNCICSKAGTYIKDLSVIETDFQSLIFIDVRDSPP